MQELLVKDLIPAGILCNKVSCVARHGGSHL